MSTSKLSQSSPGGTKLRGARLLDPGTAEMDSDAVTQLRCDKSSTLADEKSTPKELKQEEAGNGDTAAVIVMMPGLTRRQSVHKKEKLAKLGWQPHPVATNNLFE